MLLELLIIPVCTTVLTTIVLYVKEITLGKQAKRRSITEEKLKELYNELFSISLIYTDKLEDSFFRTPKGMFEIDGKEIPDRDMMMIHDIELWDELIVRIREIIHKKLHLLEEDDLAKWHQIELMILEEHTEDMINIKKYKKLEEFLIDITLKYKHLYRIYHTK